MAATGQEIETGAQAMRDFVVSVNWKGNFLPWNDYEAGAKLVVDTWDSFNTNVAHYVTREQTCGQKLYQDISAAGYGDQVSLDQCIAAAYTVLVAVGRTKVRLDNHGLEND